MAGRTSGGAASTAVPQLRPSYRHDARHCTRVRQPIRAKQRVHAAGSDRTLPRRDPGPGSKPVANLAATTGLCHRRLTSLIQALRPKGGLVVRRRRPGLAIQLPQEDSQVTEIVQLPLKTAPELSPWPGMIERNQPAVVPDNGTTD